MQLMCGEGGIIVNLEFYAGKSEEIPYDPEIQSLLKSSQVARLVSILDVGKNYKVHFDNWFTSINLLCYLKKRGILWG